MKSTIQEPSKTHGTRTALPDTTPDPTIDGVSHDLPLEEQKGIIALLNQRLAESIDLSSQIKQAHWNVKGHNFLNLHELFDRVHAANESYVDMIGERIAQLNGFAEGTIRIAAARSRLSDHQVGQIHASDHIEEISRSMRAFRNEVRGTIAEADDVDDIETVDIFTDISRGLDKWLWYLEAHTQVKK